MNTTKQVIVDTNFVCRCFHPIKRSGSRVWQIYKEITDNGA